MPRSTGRHTHAARRRRRAVATESARYGSRAPSVSRRSARLRRSLLVQQSTRLPSPSRPRRSSRLASAGQPRARSQRSSSGESSLQAESSTTSSTRPVDGPYPIPLRRPLPKYEPEWITPRLAARDKYFQEGEYTTAAGNTLPVTVRPEYVYGNNPKTIFWTQEEYMQVAMQACQYCAEVETARQLKGSGIHIPCLMQADNVKARVKAKRCLMCSLRGSGKCVPAGPDQLRSSSDLEQDQSEEEEEPSSSLTTLSSAETDMPSEGEEIEAGAATTPTEIVAANEDGVPAGSTEEQGEQQLQLRNTEDTSIASIRAVETALQDFIESMHDKAGEQDVTVYTHRLARQIVMVRDANTRGQMALLDDLIRSTPVVPPRSASIPARPVSTPPGMPMRNVNLERESTGQGNMISEQAQDGSTAATSISSGDTEYHSST